MALEVYIWLATGQQATPTVAVLQYIYRIWPWKSKHRSFDRKQTASRDRVFGKQKTQRKRKHNQTASRVRVFERRLVSPEGRLVRDDQFSWDISAGDQ